VVCTNWRQIGTDALVQGEVQATSDEARIEFRVLDVSRGCLRMVRKRYTADRRDAGRIGSAIADDIVGLFTGHPGVSDTEIAFISSRSGSKEVFVMSADGKNLRSATSNRSINSFPSWSPNGKEIVYTSYRHRNRPHLFMLTRGRKSPGRILRSLDSGAPLYRGVFSPSGDRLALVMSLDGATEILTVGRSGRDLRRLTRNRIIDISPTWSPNGKRIAFVSDRAGTPQVYVMDRDGSDVRRLTFNGSYNTAPSWSPDGRWIAYESRVGSQFDIWLIDPEGGANYPLVTHPRSDEHPTWAPDSRKIAFASTRRGHADIYQIDLNGENLRRITQGGGDNTNPAWGPFRR
jgi:TolB protein